MRIVCAWCNVEMGERCPNCADGPVLKRFPDIRYGLHFCNTCNHAFSKGYGGTTHGMCGKCLEIKMAEIKERQSTST